MPIFLFTDIEGSTESVEPELLKTIRTTLTRVEAQISETQRNELIAKARSKNPDTLVADILPAAGNQEP